MAELMRSSEYSLKVSAEQLSLKRAADISSELGWKSLKRTAYLLACIASFGILLFSRDFVLMLEAMLALGFSAMGFVHSQSDAGKFAKKEFVEMAKAN